jgi:hypothetical protein
VSTVGKGGKGGQSRNDQRANSLNPNNPGHRASVNNRSNQLNRAHPAYHSSRSGSTLSGCGGGGGEVVENFHYRDEALEHGWILGPPNGDIVGLGGDGDHRRLGVRFQCTGCNETVYSPLFRLQLTSPDPKDPELVFSAEVSGRCNLPHEVRVSGGLGRPRVQVFQGPIGTGGRSPSFEYRIVGWGAGEGEIDV